MKIAEVLSDGKTLSLTVTAENEGEIALLSLANNRYGNTKPLPVDLVNEADGLVINIVVTQ